jgi:hypothetical protein
MPPPYARRSAFCTRLIGSIAATAVFRPINRMALFDHPPVHVLAIGASTHSNPPLTAIACLLFNQAAVGRSRRLQELVQRRGSISTATI